VRKTTSTKTTPAGISITPITQSVAHNVHGIAPAPLAATPNFRVKYHLPYQLALMTQLASKVHFTQCQGPRGGLKRENYRRNGAFGGLFVQEPLSNPKSHVGNLATSPSYAPARRFSTGLRESGGPSPCRQQIGSPLCIPFAFNTVQQRIELPTACTGWTIRRTNSTLEAVIGKVSLTQAIGFERRYK